MDKFDRYFYSTLALIALLCISLLVINSLAGKKAITKMVEAGADPILAMCAIDVPNDKSVCAMPYLVRQAK